jgi:hypothetical protein
MEDAPLWVRVISDAPALGQDLVEQDPHGPPTTGQSVQIIKREGVVLDCDT